MVNPANEIYSHKDQIIDLLKQDYSAYRIALMLNFSKSAVLQYIKTLGYSTSHKSNARADQLKNHTEEIVRMFVVDKLSMDDIAVKFDAARMNILRILNKQSIDTSAKLYNVDESFFEKIDTEEKAYCLGMMFTDGTTDGNRIKLSLTDLDVIQKIKSIMKYEGPILDCPPRKVTHQPQYVLSIYRQKLAQDLIKLGCIPNKTFVITFPEENILSKHLQRHFIRGCIDGDGSVSIGRSGNYINIVGTKYLLGGIEKCFNNLGVVGKWYHPTRLSSEVIQRFTVSGFAKLKIIIDYLYKDATVYMDRKYQKAQQLLQQCNIHCN